MNLKAYMRDGADLQARCVLAFLQTLSIKSSWNSTERRYEAEPGVARWENCREQGYVVWLRNKRNEQLNIAFSESKNSDALKALIWLQFTLNSPTIEAADCTHCTNHSVNCYEFEEMSRWIFDQFEAHWKAGLPDTNK